MVKAKPKAYEDYTSPGGTEWRLRLAPGTASGYYGVIKNKGKWQGMGYDPNKQSRRSLPGLFEKPQDAAAQAALFDSRFKLGTEKIPSPKKYVERGSGALVQTFKKAFKERINESTGTLPLRPPEAPHAEQPAAGTQLPLVWATPHVPVALGPMYAVVEAVPLQATL